MINFMYVGVAVCVGLGLTLVYLSQRGDSKLWRTNLLLALALFALASSQGYAAYREVASRDEVARIAVEITQIETEFKQLETETNSGRQVAADELKLRTDRLKVLSSRLAAIRNR